MDQDHVDVELMSELAEVREFLSEHGQEACLMHELPESHLICFVIDPVKVSGVPKRSFARTVAVGRIDQEHGPLYRLQAEAASTSGSTKSVGASLTSPAGDGVRWRVFREQFKTYLRSLQRVANDIRKSRL